MVEFTIVIVEPEQQGSDQLAVAVISKTADNAVGRSKPLNLRHCPITRQIGGIDALAYHAVCVASCVGQPAAGFSDVVGGRRQQEMFSVRYGFRQCFQPGAAAS